MLKKGLIAGVVLLAFGLAFNWLSGVVFPELAGQYQNSALFRSWQDPLMMAYFGYPFILGVALAYFWEQVKVKSPLEFAKTYFLVAGLPGMFVSYTSFQVSFLMIATWSVSGFLQSYLAGLVFTKVKKN